MEGLQFTKDVLNNIFFFSLTYPHEKVRLVIIITDFLWVGKSRLQRSAT